MAKKGKRLICVLSVRTIICSYALYIILIIHSSNKTDIISSWNKRTMTHFVVDTHTKPIHAGTAA